MSFGQTFGKFLEVSADQGTFLCGGCQTPLMAYGRWNNRRRKPTKSVRIVRGSKPAAMVAKRKPAKKTYSRYRLSAPMRALVDRRINRKLEPIVLKYSLTPVTQGAGGNAYTLRNAISSLSMFPIWPAIASVSQTQNPIIANTPYRVGNQIHPKYCYLKVRLFVSQDDTTSGAAAGDRAAIQPYLFIGYNKTERSYDGLTANSYASTVDHFWRSSAINGQYPVPTNIGDEAANDCPFRGDRERFMHGTYNKSLLHCYHQRAPELVRDLGYYFGDPTTGYGGFAGKFLAQRTYNFKIPVPKVFRYSDDGTEWPVNTTFPFLAVGFTYMNGARPSQEAPLRMETSCTFVYTDA